MTTRRYFAIAVAVVLLAAAPGARLAAQQAAAAPPAAPADVSSLDSIISVLYAVISGGAGERRNWDRFRSLFIPEARLIPTGRNAAGIRYRVMSPDEYVTQVGPSLEGSGFFEREIHRETDTYGNITQLFSTYESRRRADDPEPFARGINSIQLFNDGSRWWVVTIFWDAERPGNPIPSQYLP